MKYFWLLFFISAISFAQVSPRVEEIIGKYEADSTAIVATKEIEEKSELKDRLLMDATPAELYYLSENAIAPYTKECAIQALIESPGCDYVRLFSSVRNCQEIMKHLFFDMGESATMTDVFCEALYANKSLTVSEKDAALNKCLDLVLAEDCYDTRLIEDLMSGISARSVNYNRIRSCTINLQSPYLLAKVAAYKNPADIPLITSFGKDAIMAIEEFPHEDFLPLLEAQIGQYENFSYLFALSKYCTERSAALNRRILALAIEKNVIKGCSNICLNALYNQMYIKGCPLNYPALEELWASQKILSLDILANYEKNHSREEVTNFLLHGFLVNGEALIIPYNMYDSDRMMQEMRSNTKPLDNLGETIALLKKLRNMSEDSYQQALAATLENVDDLSTDSFIENLGDNYSVLQHRQKMLEKMRTNKSAYGLFFILDGIRMLKDKSLYKEAVSVLVSRREEFRKVWEKSLQEYTKEHKIKLKN